MENTKQLIFGADDPARLKSLFLTEDMTSLVCDLQGMPHDQIVHLTRVVWSHLLERVNTRRTYKEQPHLFNSHTELFHPWVIAEELEKVLAAVP